jgi:hypothetical protein
LVDQECAPLKRLIVQFDSNFTVIKTNVKACIKAKNSTNLFKIIITATNTKVKFN